MRLRDQVEIRGYEHASAASALPLVDQMPETINNLTPEVGALDDTYARGA